jgi:hypothetical protein
MRSKRWVQSHKQEGCGGVNARQRAETRQSNAPETKSGCMPGSAHVVRSLACRYIGMKRARLG